MANWNGRLGRVALLEILYLLPLAEFWNNSNFQTIIKTPFEAIKNFYFKILSILKNNLVAAQERMTIQANKHIISYEYSVDDWLFLRLLYRQKYLGLRSHLKLSLMYFVPFRSFKGFLWILDPSSLSSIYLRPKLGKLHTTPLSTYPQVNKEGDLSPEPKEILQRTVTKLGDKVAIEVFELKALMQIMLHESYSIPCSSNSLTLWARCFSKGGISWEPSKGLVLCLPSNPNPYVVCKQVNNQNYV